MAGLVLSVVESTADVNLTSLGYEDWAIWGYGADATYTPPVRKSGGGALISASGAYAVNFNGQPQTKTWTDGTPTASGTANAEGVYINSADVISVVFPAGTGERVAKVYVGGYDTTLSITATLSDASAGPSTDNTTISDATWASGVATITYTAGSAAQTLTVTINAIATGNAQLMAAAVSSAAGGGATNSIAWITA